MKGYELVNITEFAKEAGVSKSAVSRYFNDGYLSDEKRQLIEEAIERTGYVPSISAQNVRTKVTKLVGVILPKLSSESCARVTEGISQVLSEAGYQLLLVNTANDYNKEVEYLDLFRQNRVDGVIFLASIFTKFHKSVLAKMHIPVIIVGQVYKGFSSICHDDMGAAYALTKLMLDKGGKNPGYIGVTPEDKAAGQERHDGYIRALEEHNIEVNESNMVIADFSFESGYRLAKRLLTKKDRPDCIFCATDNIAAGAMQYCRERKISIPDDVMVCGVGDSRIGTILPVTLTSAHLHYKTAGMEAAQMLLAALKRRDSIPRVLRLDYNIVERESTDRQ